MILNTRQWPHTCTETYIKSTRFSLQFGIPPTALGLIIGDSQQKKGDGLLLLKFRTLKLNWEQRTHRESSDHFAGPQGGSGCASSDGPGAADRGCAARSTDAGLPHRHPAPSPLANTYRRRSPPRAGSSPPPWPPSPSRSPSFSLPTNNPPFLGITHTHTHIYIGDHRRIESYRVGSISHSIRTDVHEAGAQAAWRYLGRQYRSHRSDGSRSPQEPKLLGLSRGRVPRKEHTTTLHGGSPDARRSTEEWEWETGPLSF